MLEIELTSPAKLSTTDRDAWTAVQANHVAFESPYFRREFTEAVAAVRSDVELAVLRRRGEAVGFFPFQRGSLNLGKPVGGKLSDYHGVVIDGAESWNAEQLVQACGLAGWDFDHLLASQTAFAPYAKARGESRYLDLTDGYEAYVAERRRAGSDTLGKQARKTRKLAREHGEPTFTWHDDSHEVFDTLLQWKRAQYAATGLADVFAFPWTGNLLQRLLQQSTADFGVSVGVLRVNAAPIAICYSLRSRHVLHAWFNSYDPAFAEYSPGIALFDYTARAAVEHGITKIDLGKGDERYKASLASGSTALLEGSVERSTLSVWLRSGWRRTRDWVQTSPLAGAAKAPGKLVKPLRNWMAMH